jgi:hypothetical protein
LGDEVALGDVVENPPHPARPTPADNASAIMGLETVADRTWVRYFIADTLLSGPA